MTGAVVAEGLPGPAFALGTCSECRTRPTTPGCVELASAAFELAMHHSALRPRIQVIADALLDNLDARRL